MRIHSSACQEALLGFLVVALLFSAGITAKNVEVVGVGECADCKDSNIKTSHALSGLRVTVDCKSAKGEFETRGAGELDKQGNFKVSLPQEIVKDGKLTQECYAQLHSASLAPCAVHNVEASKIAFQSTTEEKHTFSTTGKLKFSSSVCTSANLWPFFKYPPLPTLPPLHKDHPWFKDFGHPWFKTLPPPVPVYESPPIVKIPPVLEPPPIIKPTPPVIKPPTVPIYKPKPKPCPPITPVPVYKPMPKPEPPVYKPKPKPKPPVYKPAPVPVYKPKPKPKPEPPVYKPTPKPKPPVYKPAPVPVYKPKPKPKPEPPVYKPTPKPAPVPVYKPKPEPPTVPISKPLPPPIPIYKPLPPIPTIPPFYKKPCPPLPPLPKFPPFSIPPKDFHHPKYGGFPPLPPHFPKN